MLRNVSLSAKVSAMAVAGIAALTVLFGLAGDFMLRQEAGLRASERQESNMRVAWDVLGRLGVEFRAEGDKLYAGTTLLNDFYAPVDRVKELVGGTATVFMGDTRIATNVKA